MSSSFSASVMPSAWVREKPRCSSFLTMPFVSITSVCICSSVYHLRAGSQAAAAGVARAWAEVQSTLY